MKVLQYLASYRNPIAKYCMSKKENRKSLHDYKVDPYKCNTEWNIRKKCDKNFQNAKYCTTLHLLA